MSWSGADINSLYPHAMKQPKLQKNFRTFAVEQRNGTVLHHAVIQHSSFLETNEMRAWCTKMFGLPGYRIDTMSVAWDWSYDIEAHLGHVDQFRFGEEKHLMMFLLRFS